jgi:GntR family transcriptional regulator
MNDLKGTELREGVPLYLQIRDVITSQLAHGTWKPGEQLPTEPELSARFRVSEGTIRQALLALVKDGRLTRRSGKGTFVAKPRFDQSFARFFRFRGDTGQVDPDFRLAVIDIKVLTSVDPAVKATLDLRRSRVLAIHRTIMQDDVVVCHYVSYLSHAEFGTLTTEDMENSALYDVLESKFNIHIVQATETLQARAASTEDTEILQIKQGEPVIAVERVAYTYQEKPVEFRRTIGRSDKFRYEIQLS